MKTLFKKLTKTFVVLVVTSQPFIIYQLFLSDKAFAADYAGWNIDGELRLDAIYTLKPTADAGKTEFKYPDLTVNVSKLINENMGFYVRTRFGPRRTTSVGQTSVGQFQASLDRGYVFYNEAFREKDQVQYGLIAQPWNAFVEKIWSFSSFTDGGAVFQDRLNYLFAEDVGVNYVWTINENWSNQIWLLNGEGKTRDEVYASKDVGTLLAYQRPLNEESEILIAAGYINGHYDNFTTALSLKERILLLAGYIRKTGFSFGVEAFLGKDPVDAITQLQGYGIEFADNANLTSRGGQVAQSSGAALYSKYRIENEKKKYDLIFRADYLMPMSNLPLWNWFFMSGLSYIPHDKVTILLANNHFLYNDSSYGIGKRETDKTYLTVQVLF